MNLKKQVAVIIIPTYNEEANIGVMLDYINERVIPTIPNWKIEILIVDGHSTDNTCSIVSEKMVKYNNVYLYEEKFKEGIGAAYLKGFKYAMEVLRADVLVEFDGDFQHPPESINILLKEIENGYDYVIGSRYIAGGSHVQSGIFRILLSKIGGLTARTILFFPFANFLRVTDPTTGLKATRVRNYGEKLGLDTHSLYSKGFGYKTQLLSEIIAMGAKYKEVPLKFKRRQFGASKFQSNTIKEILISCIKTRFKFKKP